MLSSTAWTRLRGIRSGVLPIPPCRIPPSGRGDTAAAVATAHSAVPTSLLSIAAMTGGRRKRRCRPVGGVAVHIKNSMDVGPHSVTASAQLVIGGRA